MVCQATTSYLCMPSCAGAGGHSSSATFSKRVCELLLQKTPLSQNTTVVIKKCCCLSHAAFPAVFGFAQWWSQTSSLYKPPDFHGVGFPHFRKQLISWCLWIVKNNCIYFFFLFSAVCWRHRMKTQRYKPRWTCRHIYSWRILRAGITMQCRSLAVFSGVLRHTAAAY